MYSSCYNLPVTGSNAPIQKDSTVVSEDLELIKGAVIGLSKWWLFQIDLAFIGKKVRLFLSTHTLEFLAK